MNSPEICINNRPNVVMPGSQHCVSCHWLVATRASLEESRDQWRGLVPEPLMNSWRLRLGRALESDWWLVSVRLRHRQRSDWAVPETGDSWRRLRSEEGRHQSDQSRPRTAGPGPLSLGHSSGVCPGRQPQQTGEESQPRGQAPVTEDTVIKAQSWTPSERASEPDTSSAGWCRKVVWAAITPGQTLWESHSHMSWPNPQLFGDTWKGHHLCWVCYHHSEAAVHTLLENDNDL